MAEQVTYCGGFLMDTTGRVALIRKTRPAWQAGRLNGIGGHVEPGETPAEAMRREFREEAGLDLDGWEDFATLTFPAGSVWWYRLVVQPSVLDTVASGVTDEGYVGLWPADFASTMDALPNLSVLLPLARYTHDRYEPVLLAEATR